MSSPGDFPLSEAPRSARKGLLSISMVLFSFTFFTGTMFAGGKLGMAFNFVDMLWIAAIGNTLLALYAAALARLPLNVAHPVLTSGAVATVALFSVLIFREPFHWTTGAGILLVIAGVALITARVA